MPLPNTGMDAVPFTALTAEFVDNILENITALAAGTGLDAASVPNSALANQAWTSYTPVLTATSVNPTLGTGSVAQAFYTQIGKTVIYRVSIKFGTSGMATGTGEYRVSLPVTALATDTIFGTIPIGVGRMLDASTNNGAIIFPEVETSTTLQLVYYSGIGGTAGAAGVTATAPWTWAASDVVIAATLMYQAA